MSNFGQASMVRGRTLHRCEYCWGQIPQGEEHYRFKGMWDGDWQNWRMHKECWADYNECGDEEFCPGEAPMPNRVKAMHEATA